MKVKIVEFNYKSKECPTPRLFVLLEDENTLEGINLIYNHKTTNTRGLVAMSEVNLISYYEHSSSNWEFYKKVRNLAPHTLDSYRKYNKDKIEEGSMIIIKGGVEELSAEN